MQIRYSYLEIINVFKREVIAPCLHWVMGLIISDIFHVEIKLVSFGEPPPRGLHRAFKLPTIPAPDAIGHSPWLH